MPAFRRRRGGAKSEKQIAYLVQSEAGLLCALHHGEAIKHALLIAALAILALWGRENPDLFVVANS
jgi:hypothetical protein